MSAFFMYVLAGIAKLILIFLPQTLANVISIYAFNKKKINDKNFWIAIIVSLSAIFCIRLLPISFGIPTVLCMVVLILFGVYLLKFSIYKTTLGVLFIFVVSALLELVTFKVITLIFGKGSLIDILDNGFTNALAGFPSSILLFVLALVAYSFITRHVESSGESKPI
ncbi:MAG: hypothetical protein PHV07_06045 [Oscillospiraceae bacterium]|nr:hypothetical protein [Oscillospiraceae bacterium]